MDDVKGGRAAPTTVFIDRTAEQPAYIQLAEALRRQILDGVYQPGERLPSAAMLVEMFDVSPMTVRRAINLLAAQDVVATAQGRGVFVKEVALGTAAFSLDTLKELFNDEAGTTVEILEARFVTADERLARKLQVEVGAHTIYIRRLLLVKGEPAFYHRGYLIYDPARPVVEAELCVTDLKGLFQGSGSALIKSGDLSLEAVTLDEEETGLLQLEPRTPGMVLEHIFYDFDNRPVSWGWFVASSRRMRLRTRIGIEYVSETRDERTR